MTVLGPLLRLDSRTEATTLRQRAVALLSSTSSPEPVKRILYSVCSARLQARLASGPLPHHIGVVLDSNRRYVEILDQDQADAYRLGIEKLVDLLVWCDERQIPVVTVWSRSIDNMKRAEGGLHRRQAMVEEKLPHLQFPCSSP